MTPLTSPCSRISRPRVLLTITALLTLVVAPSFAQEGNGNDPEECQARFEQFLEDCIAAGDDPGPDGIPGGSCDERAEQLLVECLGDPPPPPPFPGPVPGECEVIFAEALQACASEDGTIDEACAASAAEILEACIEAIEIPDPVECTLRCELEFEATLQACEQLSEVLGVPLESCMDSAALTLDQCHRACDGDIIDPPPPGGCEVEFFQAVTDCTGEDGVAQPDCLEAAETALRECLQNEGHPDEVTCTLSCDLIFNARFHQCLTGLDNPDGNTEGDCLELVHRTLDDCMISCQPEIPEELKCVSNCDSTLWNTLFTCGDDDDCFDAAYGTYWSCVGDCGVEVPEIPEIDFCFSKCDVRYHVALESCHDPETGEMDPECFPAADETYFRCLSDCGGEVFPDLPPVPADPCVSACEAAFSDAFDSCLSSGGDPGADGLDEDCLARADEAFLACMTDCDVVVPEPPQLPPELGCNEACAQGVLEDFQGCVDVATGEIDPECVATMESRLEECLQGCTSGEDDTATNQEKRALVALLRGLTDVPNFVRGDANQDHTVDISDPIGVLAFLFLGGTVLECQDAADANDDGLLDVSDPVMLLSHLFLGEGPLPTPSGPTPGADPTVDELGCERPVSHS